MHRGAIDIVAMLALAASLALPSCTTSVQPTTCVKGSTACGGLRDARFCDDVAITVEGADCPQLGIAESRHFCVVTPAACTNTRYVVKGHDCEVLRYRAVRDSSRAECAAGTSMFVSR